MDEGVDLILLSATEATGWEDSLEYAKEAEIPVVLLDRGIEPDNTDLHVTRIAPDNVEVSTSVAEWAVSEFPDGADDFTLEGPAGVSVVNERNEGFDAVIGEESSFNKIGAQTANWTTEEGGASSRRCSSRTATTCSSSSRRTTRWASAPHRRSKKPV